MDPRPVEMREVRILGSEDKRQIGAGEEDLVYSLVIDQSMSEGPQSFELFRRRSFSLNNPSVDVADLTERRGRQRHDFGHTSQTAE